MPAVTPTPEQQAIIDQARSDESLLINALAGAAKTTTLVLLAQKLPMEPTLCLAFNKRIAEEMSKRMPGHIACSTLNSAGHRAWGSALGKRLFVDSDKTYKILSEMNSGAASPEVREQQSETFAATLRAVRIAKSMGYVPESMQQHGRSLINEGELYGALVQQLDVVPTDWLLNRIDKILEISIAKAYSGDIDFDDQIYMSTLFGGAYPRYPIILVDEAQDLSSLNHESLKKMFAGRLIAVGDPNQAIYAFRGAHHTSMDIMKVDFNMKELTLSTSFRCPIKVIENVHWHVPHMTWPEWAQPGQVTKLAEFGSAQIPDGSAVICRNNAPIFSLAIRLIRSGRGIKLIGNDIGASLVKVLQKLGPGNLTPEQALPLLQQWFDKELKACKTEAAENRLRERRDCLEVFVTAGSTLDEGIAYAQNIFNQNGPIQMMTGHKSKGGEWPIVFHLDPWLLPSKWARRLFEETGEEGPLRQERNLKYVIDTRAQEALYYINSEDFE